MIIIVYPVQTFALNLLTFLEDHSWSELYLHMETTCVYLPVQRTFLCQNPSTATSSYFWFFSLKIKNKKKNVKKKQQINLCEEKKIMVMLFE